MVAIVLALSLDTAVATPTQCCPDPCAPVYVRFYVAPAPPPQPLQQPLQRTTVRRPADVVLQWNETALLTIKTERTDPPLAARNLAMMHVAMFDAVNAISRSHKPFRWTAEVSPRASAEAAAAVAAHRVLIDLYPRQTEGLRAALDSSLAPLPADDARTEGIMLGERVAEKLLAWRLQDGAWAKVDYRVDLSPGKWQPTPPDHLPPLKPHWPAMTCFCMTRGDQFRAVGPPKLTSTEYTASLKQVKALGGVDSTVRTPEQTQIALFWADGVGTVTPVGHWNRIAQGVAQERGVTMLDNARLFALLNLALADAAIVCWDNKYVYNFWRPVTGIRQADRDGNPDTAPDPNWTSLIKTPPFPSYTSGHSTFSASAAAVLANFFGDDRIRFRTDCDDLPGVTRSFDSFSAAALEAGWSRIYGGIHWDFDNYDGLATGRDLGYFVSRNFLQPR